MKWENKINVKCVSVNLYYPYSNKISAETEENKELDIKKPPRSLIIEADELCSFVRKKQVN